MIETLQENLHSASQQTQSAASGMTLEGVASHYDDLDKFYREIWGEHVHHGLWHTGNESDIEAAENLVTMVADAGNMREGSRVCDIGCGYGATCRILAQRRGAKVTGMTISEVQLRYAREFNSVPGQTSFLLRDWYENDLADESFDVVISIESLEHMPDLPRFFAEVSRVLRPGGRFVACAWMSSESPGRLSRRHLLEAISREAQLAGIRSASEFLAGMASAGFADVQMLDLAKKVRRTWPLCAWRTVKGLLTKRHYRRFIFSSGNPNRIFALTLFRIWLAYGLGVMRYGFFVADKRSRSSTGPTAV
jgi:tocopherol O-methyltransferase